MRAIKTSLVVAIWLAFLPVLASAAPPTPKGTLVYQDDFSDPKKSGLEDNLQATDYSRGFHAPGVYHLKDLGGNQTQWSMFPNMSLGEMTVELDMWDNSDNFKGDISQGLIVRAQDNSHFYAVLVNPRKAQYAVRKLDGANKWSDLIAWKDSSLIKQQSDVNHLRVDADGNTFTMYLNGESLDTFSDSSYAKGGVGLIASNVDAANNHMHYDNIKIYSTEKQAAQPAGGTTAAALPKTGDSGDTPPFTLMVIAALLLLGGGLWLRSVRR